MWLCKQSRHCFPSDHFFATLPPHRFWDIYPKSTSTRSVPEYACIHLWKRHTNSLCSSPLKWLEFQNQSPVLSHLQTWFLSSDPLTQHTSIHHELHSFVLHSRAITLIFLLRKYTSSFTCHVEYFLRFSFSTLLCTWFCLFHFLARGWWWWKWHPTIIKIMILMLLY